MARRSRGAHGRRKSSQEMLLLVLIGFLLLVVTYFLFFNKNFSLFGGAQKDVESAFKTRDSFKAQIPEATRSGKIIRCLKNSRVSTFTLEGSCENGQRDGFTVASYKCSDGNVGTVERGCMSAAEAFAQAKVACAKAVCPPKSPKSGRTTEVVK